MKKKHFLYLSLTSLFFSTQAYKVEASMREICSDLITNNVMQRASSAYSYVTSNSSRINFTDVDLYSLCDNIITPIRNITIEQMPALRINTSNIYENINVAANLSIVTIGIITIGATIYFGYKQHKDGDLIPEKLNTINTSIGYINTTIGNIDNTLKTTNIKLDTLTLSKASTDQDKLDDKKKPIKMTLKAEKK